jgi:hypothetical protein
MGAENSLNAGAAFVLRSPGNTPQESSAMVAVSALLILGLGGISRFLVLMVGSFYGVLLKSSDFQHL